MAFFRGPNVVTNGLVLALDAANSKSYPGSGTTWNDLSGNDNSGSLINGPTYSSDNGGSIVFDGTNDYSTINNNSLARIGNSNHTITVWVNNNIVSEEDCIGTGTGTGDILLMIFQGAGGGAGGFRGHAWGSTGDSNTLDSPRVIGTGNWNMLTQRVAWGGNMDLFENGVITATRVLIGNAPTSSRTTLYIGTRDGSNGLLNGKIAAIQIYNRALSSQEVLQNYNALKSRFNLT
jgi:hypothetical protein